MAYALTIGAADGSMLMPAIITAHIVHIRSASVRLHDDVIGMASDEFVAHPRTDEEEVDPADHGDRDEADRDQSRGWTVGRVSGLGHRGRPWYWNGEKNPFGTTPTRTRGLFVGEVIRAGNDCGVFPGATASG